MFISNRFENFMQTLMISRCLEISLWLEFTSPFM